MDYTPLIKLLDVFSNQHLWLKQGALVMGSIAILLSGWHHYMAHNQDTIPVSPVYMVFGAPPNRPHRDGAKAAGYYIREHSQDSSEQIFVYDNFGNVHYYAGRLEKGHKIRQGLVEGSIATFLHLEDAISNSPNWEKVGYLVINRDNQVIWDYANQTYLLEAVITEKEQPELFIFNTRKKADLNALPVTLDAEQYELQYDQEYSHWRNVVPWFLSAAQQRL